MYSTCIHCHSALGSNESIEHFPVGRRLAFDAAKGRLWVVCARCRRWNLTPLEERWEAVEECERLFRGAPLRVSTDNIGLAKLPNVDLVRVGKPLRPEMAAWRYGESLRLRRFRGIDLAFAAGMIPLFAAQFVVSADGWAGNMSVVGMGAALSTWAAFVWTKTRVRVMLPDGTLSKRQWAHRVSLVPDPVAGWAVEGNDETRLVGPPATHSLRGFLTRSQFRGGRASEITDAVELLRELGGPSEFPRRLAEYGRQQGVTKISHFPMDVRLALEMSIHEEEERLLADGDLGALRVEWRLAEAVAQIADSLTLTTDVRERLRQLREAEADANR